MKKTLMVAVALAGIVAFAAGEDKSGAKSTGAALANARGQIAKVIANPKLMTQTMKGLSAKEQLQFVADVNKAISAMSGSEAEKTAIALNVNRSALDGAADGNMPQVLAEIYATAPVQSLTVINESFAKDVFNRATNPNVTYTDEQYINVSKGVMKTVNSRLENASDSGIRAGFAALMMIRASNSETPAIKDAVVASLPPAIQETAKNEWLPAALATGDDQSYEPMLGMADEKVSRPGLDEVLRIAGPQHTEATLADLSGANTDPLLKPSEAQPVIDAVYAPIQNDLPHLGDIADVSEVIGEVKGYQWQTTK